ncbi:MULTISPECIES: SLOG family protein [Bacteroidaceae]|uniref:SLOG family protein n=1 Tax=Bacteroidaceae TaxID=815 RepID=UPI00259183F6|nr:MULTISPECIES: SLOG family protein [Bacteroidaceae]
MVPFSGQSSQWASSEQERYRQVLAEADKNVLLSENYFRGCLLRRNDYMLSHSCGVIAYYNGKSQDGTFYTVRKAERLRMKVLNIYGQRG